MATLFNICYILYMTNINTAIDVLMSMPDPELTASTHGLCELAPLPCDALISRLLDAVRGAPLNTAHTLDGYATPLEFERVLVLRDTGRGAYPEYVTVSESVPLPIDTGGMFPHVDTALQGYDGPEHNRMAVCFLVSALMVLSVSRRDRRYWIGNMLMYLNQPMYLWRAA